MRVSTTVNATQALVVVVASLILHGQEAAYAAQNESQIQTNERLLACDGISDSAEKMACFNAVVEGLKSKSPAPSVEPPSSMSTDAVAERIPDASAVPNPVAVASPPAASAPAASPSAASPPAASAPAASPPAASADIAEAPAASTESVSTTPPVPEKVVPNNPVESPITEVAPTATTASGNSDFGLERQIAAEERQREKAASKDPEFEIVRATVINVERTRDRRFEAELDNGQVWRETQLTRITRPPRKGSSVVITKGTLGSYRMKIDGNNRMAAVRRTK